MGRHLLLNRSWLSQLLSNHVSSVTEASYEAIKEIMGGAELSFSSRSTASIWIQCLSPVRYEALIVVEVGVGGWSQRYAEVLKFADVAGCPAAGSQAVSFVEVRATGSLGLYLRDSQNKLCLSRFQASKVLLGCV